MSQVVNRSNAAPFLELDHALFKQALSAACPDNRLTVRFWNVLVLVDRLLKPVLPVVEIVSHVQRRLVGYSHRERKYDQFATVSNQA